MRFLSLGLTGMMSLAVAVVFCVVLLSPHRAAAAGALAVGLPNDVSKEGFAYAYSTGKTDRETARMEALTTCRKPASNKSPQARKLCSVLETFTDQCVAVAMDPAAGTPGVGWAIGNTKQQAESQAMARCRATAGDGRRDFCTIDNSRCDGTAQ